VRAVIRPHFSLHKEKMTDEFCVTGNVIRMGDAHDIALRQILFLGAGVKWQE
jgi:hypothetical protein